MGYTSDVAVLFYTEGGEAAYPVLKLWFDENYPVQTATEHWGAEVTYADSTGSILIEYNDVKWYDDFEHTKDVHKAFGLFTESFDADEPDARGHYECVRVGEELTDIEDERSNYASHRLDVVRRIECDI